MRTRATTRTTRIIGLRQEAQAGIIHQVIMIAHHAAAAMVAQTIEPEI